MNDAWEAQYVDRHVELGWRRFRHELAERFVRGLDDGVMDEIAITTPDGATLTADVFDEDIVIVAGDDLYSTANVDEAAYIVCRVLNEEWQVLHPSFLDSPVAPRVVDDEPAGAVLMPAYGRAESVDELRSWVVTTYSAGRDEPLRLDPDGDVPWRTVRGKTFWTRVRTPELVEMFTFLGTEVGFNRARKMIDRLSREHVELKFFLVQDGLVMSRTIATTPYCGDQVLEATASFAAAVDGLDWVRDRVLSKRARADRAKVEEAELARTEAEAALAQAQTRAEAAEERLARLTAQRDWHRHTSARLRRERDAARAQLSRRIRRQEAS